MENMALMQDVQIFLQITSTSDVKSITIVKVRTLEAIFYKLKNFKYTLAIRLYKYRPMNL